MTLAAVIFADHGAGWWADQCRAGYRHCEVVVFTPRGAVAIGGMLGLIDVEVLGIVTPEALVEHCEARGYAYIWTETAVAPRLSLLCLFTCVGVAKGLLGISNPLVWTPWQLRRAIERRSGLACRSKRSLWPLPLMRRMVR